MRKNSVRRGIILIRVADLEKIDSTFLVDGEHGDEKALVVSGERGKQPVTALIRNRDGKILAESDDLVELPIS